MFGQKFSFNSLNSVREFSYINIKFKNFKNFNSFKVYSLLLTGVLFLFALTLFLFFDSLSLNYQYLFSHTTQYNNIFYLTGFDGLSIVLVFLVLLLSFLCILLNWNLKYKIKTYILLILSLIFLLVNVFCILDFILFYFFFEAVLIPVFLMIGLWGSRERKVYAAYQFFLFTFFGSMFMLFSILIIIDTFGTDNVVFITGLGFLIEEQVFLWLAIFFALSIKVPMFPVHIWLPEAHVEAPTPGSVLLAGVLLKLGTYAMVRFLFFIFGVLNYYFFPLISLLSIFSALYASCTALIQIDLKKTIAYSSIAHMSVVVVGFFSFYYYGIAGAIFLMFSHGIVASALFFGVGLIYERFKSRIIFYFGGLISIMPVLSSLFFLFVLANVGFPTTIGFVGESLSLLGAFNQNPFVGFMVTLSAFFSVIYTFWFFVRVFSGFVSIHFLYPFFSDITRREFFIFFTFTLFNFYFGILPDYLFIVVDSVLLNIFYLLG